MKNKLTLAAFALLMAFAKGNAQATENPQVTNVTRFTLLGPGLSYEARTGQSQTAFAHAFLGAAGSFGEDLDGQDYEFRVDPSLVLQYRFYYNYAKRTDKGKRTAMNSLNYLAPVVLADYTKDAITSDQVEEASRRLVTTIGGVWGMQRNYGSRFSLDLYLGVGYTFGKGTEVDLNGQTSTKQVATPNLIGQLSIGFWLNRARS